MELAKTINDIYFNKAGSFLPHFGWLGSSYSAEVTAWTDDLFFDEAESNEWLMLLSAKKNIILQGPPGVGKTFVARRLARALIKQSFEDKTEFIQFHQSYAYEDFVQGFRPSDNGHFELKNGVFYEFCEKARQSTVPHVFIIDEINRGNLSKIFGELLMLVERDKRGKDHCVRLAYQKSNEKFYIPDNVYIIGMMNTADRSIAFIDYALRRRFVFVWLSPQFQSLKFKNLLRERGAGQTFIDELCARMDLLNDKIANDTVNLGPGFMVGHSYFCPSAIDKIDVSWYNKIIKYEIGPLLQEYWYDDREKAISWAAELMME